MELPKVVVRDNYNDYLQGKEVVATFIDAARDVVWPGERIIAFKDSIAARSDVPVPKSQQSHYIGIEGTVTKILTEKTPETRNDSALTVKVQKLERHIL
jgi:hypothetical protein